MPIMSQMPSAAPGARNLITDVPGLKVGQASDAAARTGVSVILPDDRAVAGCDVRGGGPGTRETDALAPENLVDAVDAIVLSAVSEQGSRRAIQRASEAGIPVVCYNTCISEKGVQKKD